MIVEHVYKIHVWDGEAPGPWGVCRSICGLQVSKVAWPVDPSKKIRRPTAVANPYETTCLRCQASLDAAQPWTWTPDPVD